MPESAAFYGICGFLGAPLSSFHRPGAKQGEGWGLEGRALINSKCV
jgi:hypothetical protein